MGRAIALGLVAVLVIAGAAIMGMQLLGLKKGEAARAAARARAERMRAEIYQGAPSPELAKRVASEMDPRAAGLYQLCLGRIYRQLGMARRADAALTNAGVYFKSGRRRALYQYERGRLFQDQGRAKEAEAALREAVELAIDPIHRASCRDALGEFLTNVGRVEEAERELRKAHERFAGKPGDDRRLARNLRNLGLLLWVTGRADEAEAAMRRSLAIRQKLVAQFPDESFHSYELALAHYNMGLIRNESPTTAFEQALEILKDLPADVPVFRSRMAITRLNLSTLLRGYRSDEELAQAKDALNLLAKEFPAIPQHRRVLAFAGLSLAMNGREDWQDVIAIQERLVKEHPDFPIYHRDLALTLAVRADTLSGDEAVAMATRARDAARVAYKANPKHPRYQGTLGYALFRLAEKQLDQGDYRRAAENAAESKRVEPDNWQRLFHLGKLFKSCVEAAQDDADRRAYAALAIACGERALELHPDVAARYKDLAHTLIYIAHPPARDPGRALELLRKGLELDNPYPGNLHLLRGVALVQTKQYREALAALEKSEFGVTPFWMAQAHWYLGEKDKARARYDEGARLSASEEMKALRAETAKLLEIE